MKITFKTMAELTVRLWLLLCAGCRAAAPTPTPVPLLSRADAGGAALRIAAESRPEMDGSQISPVVLSAEQLTLAVAAKQLHPGAEPPAGYQIDMPVWLVRVSGEWHGQASAPGLPPDGTVYHTMTIVLDATTGLEIESQASP